MNHPTVRRRALIGAGVATAALPLGATAASAAPMTPARRKPRPTIVLVHGAFTDASSWHAVIGELGHAGFRVTAPANPLRDLTNDAAYVASVVSGIEGPVVLVGHSYGGAVITGAARSAPNVRALVYAAAFAPDAGESLAGLSERFPKTPLADAVRPMPFPDGEGGTGTDIYIDRAAFHDVFAGDLSRRQTAALAATQRPMTEAAFTAKAGTPAWRNLPSYYQVSRHDHALHPDAQRFFARRMGARKTLELDSSHVSPISQPNAIARLIRTAAQATT